MGNTQHTATIRRIDMGYRVGQEVVQVVPPNASHPKEICRFAGEQEVFQGARRCSVVDDLWALDGGSERTKRERGRLNPERTRKEGGKRPISVAFPYKLFWKIKRLADADGIAFTRQVVNLCREGLGEND